MPVRSSNPKAFLTLLLQVVSIVFICIALGVVHWSTGKATQSGVTGDINIGLWRACAKLSGQYVFKTQTTGSDCRLGHCVAGRGMTEDSVVSGHDLCGSSKASAAFSLFALFSVCLSFYWTSLNRFRGISERHGWAYFLSALGAFCLLISWTVWVGWEGKFNDDGNRSLNQNLLSRPTFGKLKPGAGVALSIVCMLILIVSAYIERGLYHADEEAAKTRRQMSKGLTVDLRSDDEGETQHGDGYDRVETRA